jgi:hypothetical protein
VKTGIGINGLETGKERQQWRFKLREKREHRGEGKERLGGGRQGVQTGIESHKERKGKKDRREDKDKETGAEVQKRERYST